ncbi:MAG: hypothetical protein KDK11_10320 [Maritimibacter sp.]|nr:hypothetical protein [Maritimibacter sp.]
MFNKMHMIQYPTGRWGFVGKVHEQLVGKSWETENTARLAAKFVEQRFGGLPVSSTIRRATA